MRLKIKNTHPKGLSKPVKTAEKTNELAWWGLFVVFILMVIAYLLKI